ncbi:type IV pilus twitching motility protein PilT [Candidatus Microgenomates bacterium]|nr:type IV pilus twitching motility protein PilT [Candidatus Microgenomates bacterium]
MNEIQELFKETADQKASDLHLMVGMPPALRVDGELKKLDKFSVLTPEKAEQMIFSLLSAEQKEVFLANKELDFSYSWEKSRFRVNIYHQKGTMAASFRLIPEKISSLQELNLPSICEQFTSLRQGLVLVTGPSGMGKSTTLASIINTINQERKVHIVTIEDPIEYIYPFEKSIVSQREIHFDTYSWEVALRSALREDPDVVLIGEMRDYETIASALTIAETGHLVFATLHTNSAAQTIDRIVDVFPAHQQSQVKLQLSFTLEAVLCQRLLPQINGGRIPAFEILIGTSAVKNTIREGKTHLIDNIIQTSQEMGMMSLEIYLADLIKKGKISYEVAQAFAIRPQELARLTKK